MFDIGWTEMLVVACVAIIVVGPKDLPKVLRGFGRAMKSIRGLAGDFQKQFEEAVKDADLDEVKNMASGKGFAPLDDVKKSVKNFEKDVKAQMDARTKEMDDAMEAEANGLPEPKVEPQNAATQTAATRAEGVAAKAATTKKGTAKKSAAKKPAASITPAKKPAASAKRTAAKSVAPAKTATKATAKSSGKAAAKKPARKPAPKTEKTA